MVYQFDLSMGQIKTRWTARRNRIQTPPETLREEIKPTEQQQLLTVNSDQFFLKQCDIVLLL